MEEREIVNDKLPDTYMDDAGHMRESILEAVNKFRIKYPDYKVYLTDDYGTKLIHDGLSVCVNIGRIGNRINDQYLEENQPQK